MRLHYHPLSTYSRKAALGIALRNDAVELRELNPFVGDLKSQAFLALSPFGKMPVLELDDGTAVFESTSILEYLEERGPRVLLPEGKERLARHFDRIADLYLLNPIGKLFWKKTDELRDEAAKSTARAWALWEKQMGSSRYLLGDAITLPDIGAAIAAHYAETEGLDVPSGVRAYRARLEEHPVFEASREAATPWLEKTRPMREKK